jgi:fatty acid-binding protein DegV
MNNQKLVPPSSPYFSEIKTLIQKAATLQQQNESLQTIRNEIPKVRESIGKKK